MELANTKNFHRIRRATVGEIRFYEQSFDRLIAQQQSGAIDQDTLASAARTPSQWSYGCSPTPSPWPCASAGS